ncbi:FolB Dihydroneopterin aldolase [Rhabdaerophilaceae bacterium]
MPLSRIPLQRDRIIIRRIGVFAYHGVYDEEARLGQRFNITLECWLDLAEAGKTDDLTKGVSYADLAALVQEIAVSERFKLIETLGERIAEAILAQHPRIQDTCVTVEKPHAAIAALFETVEVAIHRRRAT